MSSKLFHTIVAVGITLGAAACASEAQTDETSSDQNAITANEKGGAGADNKQIADAFCDAAWPTTKGGTARPLHTTPACVDADNACANAGEPFPCAEPDAYICRVSVCVSGAWQCAKPNQHPVTIGDFGACDIHAQ